VASPAQSSESLRLNEEPLNKQIPRDKSFRADNGDDMVGLHLILRESSSALRALVKLALSSSAWIDAITHVGFADCGKFWGPAGSSQGGFDEADHSGAGPLPSVIWSWDIEAFF
jgi:hypothetical protein